MKADFWHRCWERNTLGFHQEQVHPFLEQHLSPLITSKDKHVFVPLCGKSLDMFWLADKMQVTGSELNEIACQDFFNDQQLAFKRSKQGLFTQYRCENIVLLQGDFFQLSSQELPRCDWIYDRAALIALPEEMQKPYVDHLLTFMQADTRLFLITLEFPQDEMTGPPFPIFESTVNTLFAGYQIELLATQSLADKKFAQRTFNVTSLVEKLYVVSKATSV